MFAIAAHYGLYVELNDVSNAHVESQPRRRVVTSMPPGYEMPGWYYLLRKNLYGAKDGSSVYGEDHADLMGTSFNTSEADVMIYFTGSLEHKTFEMSGVHGDDTLTFASSEDIVANSTRKLLNTRYHKVTTTPWPRRFIGMDIAYLPDGSIQLHQRTYIDEVLNGKFGEHVQRNAVPLDVGGAKWDTPLPSQPSIPATPPAPLDSKGTTTYRRIVGALIYVTKTEPAIAYACNVLAQSMAVPTERDLLLARRVLSFVVMHLGTGVTYSPTAPLWPASFADAAHADDPQSRRSMSGSAIMSAGAAIHWRSRAQHIVAFSSTEAELISLGDNTPDFIHIRRLALELGIAQPRVIDITVPRHPHQDDYQPMAVHEDNSSTIRILENRMYNGRTKAIDIRLKLIRQCVAGEIFKLIQCSTLLMLADIFTKALAVAQFWRLARILAGRRAQAEGE